ncbi:hypothetical protein [Kluyvera sichuanensis]|uniref:hypothetical protein n=1 Tax=Kluyvera sichuanensis TaxID=2725494 RepID=UPI002FD1687F
MIMKKGSINLVASCQSQHEGIRLLVKYSQTPDISDDEESHKDKKLISGHKIENEVVVNDHKIKATLSLVPLLVE